MKNPENNQNKQVHLRKPDLEDGAGVYDLIAASPPLDLNSSYCYFMFCSYFRDTSVIAESDGKTAGFISAYIVPGSEDTLFVWQVAVSADFRKMGLAGRMISAILERKNASDIRYIETTVTPSNRPSSAFFYSLAEKLNVSLKESMYIPAGLFPGEEHEDEVLYRIGPFNFKGSI